jgi:peptidoglycan/LPS O-acetylase OafA/YrhL
MRSTDGIYYSRLDHVRAVAAYLAFVWHFLHMTPQFPVPYASQPVFPFALLDEGHTGVALFMTLSGYLFAKLTGDHRIDFSCFLWSRAVRLGPLLVVVIAAWILIEWFIGSPIPMSDIVGGFLYPTWPFGTWSIAIELHFYLLFPLLLFLFRRHGPFVLLRHLCWEQQGSADNFLLALIVANLAFLAFLPIPATSYHFFEKRFLAYRKHYLREAVTTALPAPSR